MVDINVKIFKQSIIEYFNLEAGYIETSLTFFLKLNFNLDSQLRIRFCLKTVYQLASQKIELIKDNTKN